MNEEIDIIELLKRVKEGKAPKRILINDLEYCYEDETEFGDYCRDTEICGKVYFSNEYDFRSMANTKIKILDKPIIEELPIIIGYEHEENKTLIQKNRDKINEIIKFLNNKE